MTPKRNLPANPLLLAVLLFASFCFATTERANAQEKGFTLKANYPLTVGDTFLSQYDGIAGFGLIYNQPIFSDLLLRPSFEYERLNFELPIERDIETTANAYTAKLGLGYPVSITRDLRVIPEVGVGYTRIAFQTEGDTNSNDDSDPQDGISTWVAVNPRYSVSGAVEVGASFGYRAAFLDVPEGIGDTPYNRELHALTFGATLTYSF